MTETGMERIEPAIPLEDRIRIAQKAACIIREEEQKKKEKDVKNFLKGKKGPYISGISLDNSPIPFMKP